MKLKLKAAGIVAGFFALAIAVQGVLVLAVETYGAQAVLNTFVGCVLLFMIYQMYTLILQRLESDKKILDLVDRK